MKEKEFEELLERLDFDVEEPHNGHRERFFKKLQQTGTLHKQKGRTRKLWTPIISIAASFLLAILLLGQFLGNKAVGANLDLASISPEMKQTQEFYSGMISKELNAINAAKTPETEAIIDDAMLQMEKLEKEYQSLKDDLAKSGKDNRVIHAMIQNFQQRIDLLNNALTQIENIKSLKNQTHENNII